MSYKLNKTDGSLLVDLVDGLVDTDTTDLTLIGRNYTGFGEFLNENFIKLLENFSNTAAPSNPILGQLWYDTSESRLKIYNGEQFVVAGAPFVQKDQPQMVAGDLWINNETNQMYFFDGSDLQVIGPMYTAQQGKSGFEVLDITDDLGRIRRVLKLWISAQLVAVFSNLTFTPGPGNDIAELPGEIKKGINLVDSDNFKFHGTASKADLLTTGTGGTKSASQFLPSDDNGTTVGSLTIQNSNGLTIGVSQNNIQRTDNNAFLVENQLLDNDYRIRVRSSAESSNIVDAITIKPGTKRVGIWNETPSHTLDVTGNCRITGNLTVEGQATISSQPVALSLDTTGLDNAGIASVLDDLFPAAQKADGTIATVHTVEYTGPSSVTRGLKRFNVVSGAWVFDTDL